MCLIVVAWRAHPHFPCIIAANRDEFHARPAEIAHWWPDRPEILAGRDRTAGGTWLGLTRGGRFAALTNFRSPKPRRDAAPSRGALVADALDSTRSLDGELAHLQRSGSDYNGFNILVSDGRRLGTYTNVTGRANELGPGIYGLSNHVLDTPWPKVETAKTRLRDLLSGDVDSSSLLSMLRDDRPARDEDLPRTGLSLDWERLLSSAFVLGTDYGTRCSTVIRIDVHGRTSFVELSWNEAGEQIARNTFEFESPAGPGLAPVLQAKLE